MAEGRRTWVGYTPAGQRLVVEHADEGWFVTCDARAPVRNELLDLALVEALRDDVEAHWSGIDRATWTRLIADSIVSTSPTN